MNIQPEDNFDVRVRAQVMLRDDSTGGWLPMGGGGLSNVSVKKRIIHHDDFTSNARNEYLIYGRRISDNSVVLSCLINKDFEYNKVMPTFHHWKTGNMKFGLTFQTAADARAFDKGVKAAIQDLLDGLSDASPLHRFGNEATEDEVFMQLDLPVDGIGSPQSSTSQGSASPQCTVIATPVSADSKSASPHHGLLPVAPVHSIMQSMSDMHFTAQSKFMLENTNTKVYDRAHGYVDSTGDNGNTLNMDFQDYSYVKFPWRESVHEYSYPRLGDTLGESKKSSPKSEAAKDQVAITLQPTKHGSARSSMPKSSSGGGNISSLAAGNVGTLDLVPTASPLATLTCAFCRKAYTPERNHIGSCSLGPTDYARKSIEAVSCLQCATCMLYHCMSDSEGDFAHPCDCTNSDGHWLKRWLGLSLLSILVPCLCCYFPLMGCYKCGAFCRICGVKHESISAFS